MKDLVGPTLVGPTLSQGGSAVTEEQAARTVEALEKERAGYERRRDQPGAPDAVRERMAGRVDQVDQEIRRLRPPAQTRLRRGGETRG